MQESSSTVALRRYVLPLIACKLTDAKNFLENGDINAVFLGTTQEIDGNTVLYRMRILSEESEAMKLGDRLGTKPYELRKDW